MKHEEKNSNSLSIDKNKLEIELTESLSSEHKLNWPTWKSLNWPRVVVGRSKQPQKLGFLKDNFTRCECDGIEHNMKHLNELPNMPIFLFE